MTGAESWRLTQEERRRACDAFVAAATFFLGPFGPMVVWGFDYLYDRRDLLFTTAGKPARAIAADSSVVQLSALGAPGVQPLGTLLRPYATVSVNTALDDSGRRLGIRNGDPVSLLLTGHTYVQARSGLVVPSRIGEQTTVAVPRGTYSVTAFAAGRESLFTTTDPYRVAAGETTVLSGNANLALSLAAREPLPESFPTPWHTDLLGLPPVPASPRMRLRQRCLYCGREVPVEELLSHMLACPSRRSRWLRSRV